MLCCRPHCSRRRQSQQPAITDPSIATSTTWLGDARFPGQHSKRSSPRPERPSEPNTGFVRYEPGAFHPRHRHDFAQVWHILEGTFKIGDRTLGPGTVVFYADPHFEEDLSTETGGLMFFVQYTGPETGKGPIYDGRFNMKERKPLSEENLKV